MRFIESEEKIAKNGNFYRRFKNEDGKWFTCFDKKTIGVISHAIAEKQAVKIDFDIDKGLILNASPYIEENMNFTEGTLHEPDKHLTMWVSYAKDIFIEIIKTADKAGIRLNSDIGKSYMEDAISLVKQAREGLK